MLHLPGHRGQVQPGGPRGAGGRPRSGFGLRGWFRACSAEGQRRPRGQAAPAGAVRVRPALCPEAALRERLRRSRVRGGARPGDGAVAGPAPAAVAVLRRMGGRAPADLPPKMFLCQKAGSATACPAPWEVLVEDFVPKHSLFVATCSSLMCGTVNCALAARAAAPGERCFVLSIPVSAAAGSPGHFNCGVFCQVSSGGIGCDWGQLCCSPSCTVVCSTYNLVQTGLLSKLNEVEVLFKW